MATRDSTITEAHILIEKLRKDIIEETPLNRKNLKDSKEKHSKETVAEIDFSNEDSESIEEPIKEKLTYSEPDVFGKGESQDDVEPVFSDGGE